MMHQIKIFLICLTLLGSIPASAQSGLNIAGLLDGQFRDDKNAVETIITGEALSDYDLSTYHSLSLTDSPKKVDLIESAVIKDLSSATDKEVSYRGGKLYYAFFSLPPLKTKVGTKTYRYIFYLNQYAVGRDGVTLIYMSGIASKESVKQMLKK